MCTRSGPAAPSSPAQAVAMVNTGPAGLLGPRLQVRLVELHDVRAGRQQVRDLLVDGLRVSEREGTRAMTPMLVRPAALVTRAH